LKLLESVHFLIRKNITSVGYSLNTPIVLEVLRLNSVNEFAQLLRKCIRTNKEADKNVFDLLQYVGDSLEFDFDNIDMRHKATALMFHLYDHCWNTSGILGTDVIDFFNLQSYMIAIEDQEFVEDWLVLVNILLEYIQSIDYSKGSLELEQEIFADKLRSEFNILEFPKTDCSSFDFEFWGGYTCVNQKEKDRLSKFLFEYYPGLEKGLIIL
jgi:hypothetical protein